MLKPGDPVPEFAFSSEAFGSISQASLRGKRYIMYFYPKDDTPGCTREACAFRDNLPKFSGLSVKVFGISADDEKSHIRFSRKHSLNFKLIPDPDHVICEAFGTWVEKSMYGRTYMGVARSTFVIGPDGKIEKVWEKVIPDGHAEEVFAWLNGDPVPAPLPTKPKLAQSPIMTTGADKASVLAKVATTEAKSNATQPAAAKTPVKATPAPTKRAKSLSTVGKKTKSKSVVRRPTVTKKPVKKSAVKSGKKGLKKVTLSKSLKKAVKKVSSKPIAKKVASKKSATKKKLTRSKLAKKPTNSKKPASKRPAQKSVVKKSVAKKIPAKKPATKKVVKKKAQR